jgi:hypothetical protein
MMLRRGDYLLVSQEALKKTKLEGKEYFFIYLREVRDNKGKLSEYLFKMSNGQNWKIDTLSKADVHQMLDSGALIKCSEDQQAKLIMLYGHG